MRFLPMDILFEGETVASVDDILETANHFKLVDYMLDIADKELTEDMMKEFHKILKRRRCKTGDDATGN